MRDFLDKNIKEPLDKKMKTKKKEKMDTIIQRELKKLPN